MSRPQKARTPLAGGARAKRQTGQAWRAHLSSIKALYGAQVRIPKDWRDRLPSPRDYYAARVENLTPPNPAGWAQGTCPFHDDTGAAFAVRLTGPRGAWRCNAGCGAGDLVAFEQKRCGTDFKAAVHSLVQGGA